MKSLEILHSLKGNDRSHLETGFSTFSLHDNFGGRHENTVFRKKCSKSLSSNVTSNEETP